jgi:hypothetical protein
MADEKPRPDPRRAEPRPTRFFLGSAGESPAVLAQRLRDMVAKIKADEADEE